MKFMAMIRQIPDAQSAIKIGGGKVDLAGNTLIIDQMDEYGVEEIIKLKEAQGGEAVVVAFGPERTQEAVRHALSMGADRAILITAEGYVDPVTQAQILAQVIAEEAPDLVFAGGQEADWDSQALGAVVAEALGWPIVSWASQLELEAGKAKVRHDLDSGSEYVRVTLPAVITTQQGLNEPRYPTLPNIMKAKKKEVKKLVASDLGLGENKVQIAEQAIQEKARLGKFITAGDDPASAARKLVELLHEEAKVI
jgi:electron transfer flavoprotein beta subunit